MLTMTPFVSGRTESIPYSLSRWTDLPAAKWSWFLAQLHQGWMHAFDPRSAIPRRWSLAPEETLGLVFWTKDPSNLIRSRDLLKPYHTMIHVTATGWQEVEKGAPKIEASMDLLSRTVAAFGPHRVTWRFSPVPLVANVVERFARLARAAEEAGLERVYLSFLQPNDRLPETRDREERLEVLAAMASVAPSLRVLLCNEDSTLHRVSDLPRNLTSGVCAPPEDFGQPGLNLPPSEGCGCVLMADPFTLNESCVMNCSYCYASDVQLSPRKRNTTKALPILR